MPKTYGRIFGSQTIGNTNPIILSDEITTLGYIAVFEPGHSSSKITHANGAFRLPANNETIINLARNQFATDYSHPIANIANTDFNFIYGTDNGPTKLQIERTAKGGIHCAISQINATTSTKAYVKLANTLLYHFISNMELQTLSPNTGKIRLFSSLWYRPTRLGNTSGLGNILPHTAITHSAGDIFNFRSNTNAISYPVNASEAVNNIIPERNPNIQLTNGYRSAGAVAWSGSSIANSSAIGYSGWGTVGPYNIVNYINFSPSHVLYRWSLVDLVKAGLSARDAHYLDYREWLKAFSPAGTEIPDLYITRNGKQEYYKRFTLKNDGRYYGDSWTIDPTTIP